ncbi:MAG: 50S ribosomal protein L13 [Rhodobacteraceae bacterium]|nr:50S ribosomal protein L13 [Paracoccaceae bacterium]
MRTYSAKPADIAKEWVVIDAEGIVLGRLSAFVASRLRGKHKSYFTPHVDCGDHVIIINAEKVQLTGRKRKQKTYFRHTGYPGGIRSRTAEQILSGRHPERIVTKAVQRMLPSNRLSRKLMTNLRVYAGSSHPHDAQKPKSIAMAAMNIKNSRRAAQ